MAVLGDWTKIVGDTNERIGDPHQSKTFKFPTGGRRSIGDSYISLMVKGMTVTSNHAQVKLNGKNVGVIFNNKGGRVNEWQNQIINFVSSDLNNGDNLLEISSVTYAGSGEDHFDDFFVRSVICHFHQHS